MTSTKYIDLDVHKESISIAVRNAAGKVVMECLIETTASMILQFIDGLRGDLQVTFEEGTWAAWLHELTGSWRNSREPISWRHYDLDPGAKDSQLQNRHPRAFLSWSCTAFKVFHCPALSSSGASRGIHGINSCPLARRGRRRHCRRPGSLPDSLGDNTDWTVLLSRGRPANKKSLPQFAPYRCV